MLRSIKSSRQWLGVLALGLLLGAAALLRGGTEPPPGVAAQPDRTSTRERRAERPEAETGARAADPIATETGGFFTAVPGEEFRYDLSARWLATTEVLLGDQPQAPAWKLAGQIPPRVTTDVSGTLRVTIVDRRGGEIRARFSLEGATIRVRAGGALPFDATPLARPALVRLTEDGRILGYAFQPEVPSDSRTLLVALFAASQQFVARDSVQPWTVAGLHDDVGAFIARFEWRPPGGTASDRGSPTIRRTIVKYDSSSAQAVEKSSSEATFGGRWIAGADVEEERIAEIEGLLRARTTLRLRTRLIERLTVAIPIDAAGTQLDWALHFAAAPEATGAATGAAPSDEPVGDAGERLGEALDRLRGLAAAGGLSGPEGFELWSEIADLARRSPGQIVPDLVELLRSGELPTGMQNWIASALGKAGGEGAAAAAEALAGIVADASVSADTRLAALVAAHQLGASVTPELLGAAADLLLGEAGSEMDAALANAAALLLGSQAGNAQLAGDQMELALAGLDFAREVAFERGEPQVYLDALLNSGRGDLLEEAIGYLSNDDELVRQAASEALAARVDDPRVLDALLAKLGSGDTAAVRSAAIDALASAEPSPAAAGLLVEIALGETDPGLRSRAVSALGEYAARGSGEARDGLARIGEPASGPVAEQARRALSELS